MGCFLGCGSGMLNWCINIDQQHGEHCHSSCSTLAHDRGKNNAPTVDRPSTSGWQKRARVLPPLLLWSAAAYYGYLVLV